MAAGVTFEPIQTHTFTGSQADVTFSSISQLYTHLFVLISAQLAITGYEYRFRFNGDTGSNYFSTRAGFTSTTATSNREDSLGYIGTYNSAGTLANVPDAVQAWIPYYTSTTFKKNMQIRSSGGGETTRISAFWNNTSAITSLSIVTGGQNLTAGSTVTLFGIAEA